MMNTRFASALALFFSLAGAAHAQQAQDLRYTKPDGTLSSDPTQVYGPLGFTSGAQAAGQNALYGSIYNDIAPGTVAFPTAITGHAENHSQGSTAFAGYFEAKGYVPGVVTTEIDAFNEGQSDAPATYPWGRGFGIPTPLPIAITCGAGGATYKAGACMEIVREGSTGGQFQFGITMQKDAAVQAGIVMDADADTGPKNNLVLRNTGQNGAIPILLQTTGADSSTPTIQHLNAAGQQTWAIRNDGTAEFNQAINLTHASFPDMRWMVMGGATDQKIWSAWASSDGAWHLRTANDAFSVGQDVMTVHRNGVNPTDVTFSAPVRLPVKTVATLPACNSGLKGGMVAVSDALNPSWRGALTGGGAVTVAAFCDGASWRAN